MAFIATLGYRASATTSGRFAHRSGYSPRRPTADRGQCVTLFTEELSWLKGRDLDLVMGRAVCDWLGWKR